MPKFFEIIQEGNVLIIIPVVDLLETVFDRLSEDTVAIVKALEGTTSRALIIDFHRTQRFGSTAIGYFVTLWKRIRERSGHMAFCNLSQYEKEVLRVTKLDQVWPLCDSRENAMKVVSQ